MHFRNTQELLHFYSSASEDLRETQKKAATVVEKQEEQPEEEKAVKPRRGRKA